MKHERPSWYLAICTDFLIPSALCDYCTFYWTQDNLIKAVLLLSSTLQSQQVTLVRIAKERRCMATSVLAFDAYSPASLKIEREICLAKVLKDIHRHIKARVPAECKL